MIPHANAARWRPAVRSRWLTRAVKGLIGAVVLSVLAQYLAGYLFLCWVHADPKKASPLTIARYAYYYRNREDVRLRLIVSSGLGFAAVAACVALALKPKSRALHGDATFATPRQIARAGLFADSGIFLGRFGGRYLIMGGQQGAIVSAPPRSDKGTAIVVPNALMFAGSLLCQDIKGELWHLTAGFRQRMGQQCYRVNPLDPRGDTARTNPLSYVSPDPNLRISGLQRIGATLFPEVPGTDPFWTAGGRGMFLGLSLYVLETPSLPPTLGEVLRQGMASDSEGFSAHWKRIISGRQSGRHPLSAPCVRAISDIIDLAPVTASSIRKTFTSRLDLFANPLIDAATSANDFDWRKLRKCPMSVYLCMQPGDLHLLRPLQNLFIEQAIALQTEELPEHNPALKFPVLMLLDEMTAPGKIPILAQAISYLPGYNVRFLLVIQALSQLRDVYGPNAADTMMKSLAARVLYAPKDFAEANEISQELGFTTVKVKSHSKPQMALWSRKNQHGNVSVSEQKRALLLPQEVKELGRDNELVLYEGLRPILAKKNRYYQDPFFKKRLFPPPARAVTGPRSGGGHPSVLAPTEPTSSANDAPVTALKREAGATTVRDSGGIQGPTTRDLELKPDALLAPMKAEDEPLTREELDRAVESFISALPER
jgi:type IV secretion system protein VirD4